MAKVYVVFCMDTEGPCDDPNNNELLKTWDDVDKAMDKLFSVSFRKRYSDSKGSYLKIGWFFLTWTGFIDNPRNRDIGYHKVRDHYIKRWGDLIERYGDEHCWHYHHPPKSKVGNEWGLDWFDNKEYANIISRQIIERNWFPVCYRSGGTIHTTESSNWVDNWFPFDYSNRSPVSIDNLVDWSKAKDDWTLYKPDIYDFTKEGFGKRYIARTLDLKTNVYSVGINEIEKAFITAQSGKSVVLSVFDHDYRDIADRIHDFISKIESIEKKYSDISWEFATPSEAIRKTIQMERIKQSVSVEAAIHNSTLRIWTSDVIYQNIPWIALKNKKNEVIQIIEGVKQETLKSWEVDISRYGKFDTIGIGVSNSFGESDTFIIKNEDEIFGGFFRNKLKRHPINFYSINEHSKLYPKLCIDRIQKKLPEMDSIKQLYDIIESKGLNNASLLDVGCAAGQISLSAYKYNIDYTGIDAYQRGVELGKLILGQNGFDKSRLINISLYNLDPKERFDIVVNLFEFRYLPQFELALEIMARAANKYLIIRSPSFGKTDKINFLPDVLLEKEFQTMRSYFNIFSTKRIEKFLEFEGFEVEWVEDIRQKEVFNSKPEIVGGIEFNYKFLVAKRIGDRPTREKILGPYWSKHATLWLDKKQGLPSV